MKQVQNLNHVKINIAKIISDCKVFKNCLVTSDQQHQSSYRIKTQTNIDSNLTKSLDFDTCVKNIRNKARSLYSSKNPLSPTLSKVSSHKLNLNQYQIQQSSQKDKFPKKQIKNHQNKSTAQFPRLLAKYHKSYSPKNASSSEKYSYIDKKSDSSQKNEDLQKSESYHTLLGERRKAQEMKKMFIMGKIVKQNVMRQKKILINKRKQRRLQFLNFKEITLSKTCISS